jgi:hypothetical protein
MKNGPLQRAHPTVEDEFAADREGRNARGQENKRLRDF